MMKERGILFSAPMVRSLLAGRKTMTRRLVKVQPPAGFDRVTVMPLSTETAWSNDATRQTFTTFAWDNSANVKTKDLWLRCPYGAVGDQLWVRETWLQLDRDGWFNQSKPKDWTCPVASRKNAIAYKADSTDSDVERCLKELGYRWESPIHMPRWASRITLEITGVHVERVQDISQADVIEEGVQIPVTKSDKPGMVKPLIRITGKCDPPYPWPEKPVESDYYRHEFAFLWDEINGAGSWAANLWTWVISFKRLAMTEAA